LSENEWLGIEAALGTPPPIMLPVDSTDSPIDFVDRATPPNLCEPTNDESRRGSEPGGFREIPWKKPPTCRPRASAFGRTRALLRHEARFDWVRL